MRPLGPLTKTPVPGLASSRLGFFGASPASPATVHSLAGSFQAASFSSASNSVHWSSAADTNPATMANPQQSKCNDFMMTDPASGHVPGQFDCTAPVPECN